MSVTVRHRGFFGPHDALREAVHRFRRHPRGESASAIFTSPSAALSIRKIWEDPEVDLKALALKPGARMIAIASGG